MKKRIVLMALLFCLAGCGEGFWGFFTGKKITTIDPVTKEKTVTYEKAPIEDWIGVLSVVVPGLGIGAAAAARLARNAARARDGIMDANEEAIENADWSKVNSAESFKVLLKTAQASHKDAKVLRKGYVGWKEKRETKKLAEFNKA